MFGKKGLGLCLLGILATVSLAMAQPTPSTDGPNLSPEQKVQLRAVMDGTKKDLDALYRQLGDSRKKLFQQFDSYTLDEQQVKSLMNKINKIQNQIMKRHLRTQRDIRKIVNPSQFEELKKFRMQRQPWPDRRPGRRWQGGPHSPR
jgi:Spy/CpxP family protein refolding chaperone